MAINPEEIDLVTVDQLDNVALALANYVAHCAPGDKLGKATIQDLANFIAPYVSNLNGSPFVPFTGTVLPNPISKSTAVTFAGAGTFTQTTGGNVTTTQPLNVLFWTSDGTTGTWSIGVAIPIDLSGYVTNATFNTLANTVNGADVIVGAPDVLTTYTVTGSAEYTRVNKLLPIPNPGTFSQLQAYCFRAGNLDLTFWRLSSGSTYKCIAKVSVVAVIGINTYNVTTHYPSFKVLAGDFMGVTQPTGQALVGSKTRTGAAGSSTDNTIAVGDLVVMGTSNSEFAIKGTLDSEGFDERIDTLEVGMSSLEDSIDDIEADLATNVIRVSDLTLVASTNLAKDEYRRDGVYVNTTTGFKVFASNWQSVRMPVTPGQVITFGRFSIDTAGASSFWDATENPAVAGNAGFLLFNGSYNNSSLPKTVTAPALAAWLYIIVKRPANNTADSSQLTINNGAELLAYEDPADLITHIKGYAIGGAGGGSSDVISFSDLDDVPSYAGNANKGLKINDTENGVDTFTPIQEGSDASFGSITATGFEADLPTGAGVEPGGLVIRDVWIDTTNSTLKVKLS